MKPDNTTPGIGAPRSGQISTEKLNSLLAELRDFDNEIRARAATELGNIGDPAVVDPLRERLSLERSPEVRMLIADSLYRTGDARVWPVLKDSLSTDSDPAVRQKVAELMVLDGDPAHQAALTQRLLKDSTPVVRQRLAEMLGKTGNPTFADALVSALEDRDLQVRRKAVDALGVLKNPEVIEKLIAGLGDYTGSKYPTDYTPSPDVYFDALVAMGPMVGEAVLKSAGSFPPRAVNILQDLSLVETGGYRHFKIEQFLQHRNSNSRFYVDDFYRDRVGILTRFATSSIQVIAKHVDTKSAVGIQIVAVRTLGQMDTAEVTHLLCQFVQDVYAHVTRWLALTALENNTSQEVEDTLISLSRSDDAESLRIKAIEILKSARIVKATPILRELASSERNTNVRHQAITALGELKDTQAIPLLGALAWSDLNFETRSTAVKALGATGDQSSARYVLSALGSDINYEVRAAAALSLSKLLGNDAFDKLSLVIRTDESSYVRRAAAEALAQIGNDRCAELLHGISLSDRDDEVRNASVNALGTMKGSKKAVERLASLLQTSPRQVTTNHILSALEQNGSTMAGDQLVRFMNQSKNFSDRVAAIKTLGRMRYQPARGQIKRYAEMRADNWELREVRDAAQVALKQLDRGGN